ncbi:MAG: hypothetical protein IH948_06000 [Bacteroidetes bacterium]|nr:hypothetical protein [Bacteroidota bacterium]
MEEKNVVIYTTPACMYCKAAKDFFKEKNIEYTEQAPNVKSPESSFFWTSLSFTHLDLNVPSFFSSHIWVLSSLPLLPFLHFLTLQEISVVSITSTKTVSVFPSHPLVKIVTKKSVGSEGLTVILCVVSPVFQTKL